jgi:hypothetical protein
MNRRSLLTGIVSLVAMPSIVRADSLMALRGDVYRIWQCRLPLLPDPLAAHSADWMTKCIGPNGGLYQGTWTFFGKDRNIYSDEVIAFSKREMQPLSRRAA